MATARRVSLRLKFAVLVIAVGAAVLGSSMMYSVYSQERQAEAEMLEKAQILAQEMDAVWAFFETNQHYFKTDENGNYELYCVIAAKAVSRFFTSETDYTIHYTNITTRRAADAPDAFETEAMEAFIADPSLKEYYALSEYEGNQAFRYVEPLYMVESCLECHGEPAGELDSFGYPKEGKQVGDIAGAISIVMPVDLYMDGVKDGIVRSVVFFGVVLLIGFALVWYGVSKLVTRPVRALERAAEEIEGGNLDIEVAHIGSRDEIADLACRINSMAAKLRDSYENLESLVRSRTEELATANEELARANAELEAQRATLEQANAVLQETNEFKSDFLAIMSHELRTPLTSIIAFTEIWEKTNSCTDERERAAVHEVRDNGQLLLTMVNNILEMARSEAGRNELMVEPVDMDDLINTVEKTLGFIAEKRAIELSTSVDADVPIIMADWEKLRRIIENLVSNAIKYTKRGGWVHVSVTRDEARDGVVIAVADNGIGISAEDLPHVFDKYIQIDRSSQKRYSGSGLGLAVVKELVALHGGEVWVESAYKEGSTFSVFIPSGDNSWEEASDDEDNAC